MQDPFYHKQRRVKNRRNRMLDADAWLDTTLYEFWQSIGAGYTRFQDFMAHFHVSGFKRLFVELFSDILSLGAIAAVLMAGLALPAFDATANGFNRVEDLSVTFLDKFGHEIGRRGIRADDSYPLDKLPDYLIKATLATEDRRFYDHFGVDVWGTMRAVVSNAQGDSVQGGSSITQQLAKNLFLSSERTIDRKIKEAFLAVWLESHYSKDEILKMYYDHVYMGAGNFGVAAAAEYYFGKPVTDISLAEAAMLSGLYKAPSKYSPTVDLAAARGRANQVLTNLVDAGFMTEGQVTAARRNPATPIDHTADPSAPDYFLDYAFEQVKQLVAGKTNETNFVVRTTLDPTLQSYAEDAVNSTMRDLSERYHATQAAMVATTTEGAIVAMIGGVDYAKNQFNRATDSLRQPGSSFKIFDYSTAFEMLDYKPTTVVSDRPICIDGYCPQNFERSFSGNVSLQSAFAESINTVAVGLSVKTGRQPIADMAHKMGITNDFPVTRSLPLGVAAVAPIDMASAYAVAADDGLKTPAYGITRITTLTGDVIYQHDDSAPKERLWHEQTVLYMHQLMRAVITSGTGRNANVPGVPVVGKTGTTSSFRDAWFCGYTGNYVAVVWYGNDDYSPTNHMQGAHMPAITWQKFMAYAHTNIQILPVSGIDFKPAPVVQSAAAGPAQQVAPRPPALQPEAAQKLLDIADDLHATLAAAAAPANQQASITPANAPQGI
ncbi:MAG TPA: PBP1A family penicillin-binding protein [Devosiaceae bacterium]|nr:PBP1A family penicillin-binding protein [Devosiaceae bacterium]